MYHSITIGNKNTWTDWFLIPTSRPIVTLPQVKIKHIEIPGVDGELDVSALLTGRAMYGNRQGSWEFLITKYQTDWVTTYSTIANYLHGQWLRATLEDDPLYFYEGRFSIQMSPGPSFSSLTINYNVGPYKRLLSNPNSEGKL